jgi:hypothetical protein
MPPHPVYHAEALPIVDQILVVRVIEYRPYYPMRATLDVQVLEGQTQSAVFATTATWSGEEYESLGKTFSLKKALLCREPACLPAPGHNSPQALMHEIAGDLAAWYNHASTSLLITTPPKKSWRDNWKKMFADETCPPASSLPASSPSTSCLTEAPAGSAPVNISPPVVPEKPPAELPPVPPAADTTTDTAHLSGNPNGS